MNSCDQLVFAVRLLSADPPESGDKVFDAMLGAAEKYLDEIKAPGAGMVPHSLIVCGNLPMIFGGQDDGAGNRVGVIDISSAFDEASVGHATRTDLVADLIGTLLQNAQVQCVGLLAESWVRVGSGSHPEALSEGMEVLMIVFGTQNRRASAIWPIRRGANGEGDSFERRPLDHNTRWASSFFPPLPVLH